MIVMEDSLSFIILALMGVVIYLLLTLRKNKEEPKDNSQELNNLKAVSYTHLRAHET